MRLQPKTVKILALLATGLLVVVVAFAAVMTVLIRDAGERHPQINAFAAGRSVTVSPIRFCTIKLQDCTEEGTPATLSVPPGGQLELSLPSEISGAPWRLLTVFQDPNGLIEDHERYYAPDETKSVTIASDGKQLNGIEIQLPSAVVDENGVPRAHAIWSIKTA